jgi:hypothetical protein
VDVSAPLTSALLWVGLGTAGELLYTFYEDAGKGVPPECQAKIVEAVRAFPSRVPAQ